ncbi:MAG: ester cyclase [Bacteroidota bacterium]
MRAEKEAFMTRWYNELWNRGNEDIIDEMLHPECKAYGLGAEPFIGPAEFKYFYRAFKRDYSDINVVIERTLVDGNFAISICIVSATYLPTDREVKFSGTSIAEIENGQLINGWNHFDFLTLNMQTGKIKPEQLA